MEQKAIKKYERDGEQLLAEAQAITIVDDTTRELATEFSTNARKVVKIIEAEFKPDIDAAHKLHKSLLERVKALVAPFKEAQAVVDGEIKRDFLEREKERREVERQENLRLEAERKRQEAERTREIEEAVEAGDMEEAEVLADSEVVVVPTGPPVAQTQKTVKSTAGSSTVRSDIKVTLVSKGAVILAVYKGQLPDTLLEVNVGAAKRYAKATGTMVMPGFRVEETAVVSGRVR